MTTSTTRIPSPPLQVPFASDAAKALNSPAAEADSAASRAAATERFKQLPPAGSLPTLPALLGALRDARVELRLGSGEEARVGRVGLLWSRPIAGGGAQESVGLIVGPAPAGGEAPPVIQLVDVAAISGLRILDVSGDGAGLALPCGARTAPPPPPPSAG